MNRAYYSATVEDFLNDTDEKIIGSIVPSHSQEIVHQQTRAWEEQIRILREQLAGFADSHIAFEALIPRMGKRADVVFLYKGIVFVLEFKVGETSYKSSDISQVESYTLDFQYFHAGSQNRLIVPVLVATKAKSSFEPNNTIDRSIAVVQKTNGKSIKEIVSFFSNVQSDLPLIDMNTWLGSKYKPTPTIIEAARALYADNAVEDIAQCDATVKNLSTTTREIKKVIHECHLNRNKAICFVTGVPGAGKTLVGLNIATRPTKDDKETAVYLSGNGPLVNVLRQALIQDSMSRGEKKSEAEPRVKTSIQNVHHFRQHYGLSEEVPAEHVVIFDEAQRAWDEKHLVKSKPEYKGLGSEPDVLLSSMNRRTDWCVVIALVGTGQEINSGEAGVSSWLTSVREKFPDWKVYYSSKLKDQICETRLMEYNERPEFHLSASQRSFRASNLASLIDAVLGSDSESAKLQYKKLNNKYPVVLTRKLSAAKSWIKAQCRGEDRMGILSSSSSKRLRAEGVFNSMQVDERHWFLADKSDIRSSNVLEEAVSEFKVQGLELDWAIVGWDADLRYSENGFEYYNFSGSRWTIRHQQQSRKYLENAYRVLLTRARQGMIIYIPEGCSSDLTRQSSYYDGTFEFLKSCGLPCIDDL
jgi:hypothetical protein